MEDMDQIEYRPHDDMFFILIKVWRRSYLSGLNLKERWGVHDLVKYLPTRASHWLIIVSIAESTYAGEGAPVSNILFQWSFSLHNLTLTFAR
jgi:hypothetical protein